MIANNSSSVELLTDYLEWKFARNYQIELSPLETCLQDTSYFIKKLRALSSDSGSSDGLLFVFTKMCTLLAESGYIERCIAAFQAQIEFNCFSPPAFARYSFDDKVIAFQEFWDSEIPRFGESNYVSWRDSILADIPAVDFLEPMEKMEANCEDDGIPACP